MPTSTLLLRILFFSLSYFALAVQPVFAQSTQYAAGVVPTPVNVSKSDSAADRNMKTAAILQPDLVQTGTATERVLFTSVIPAGSRNAGLSMRINNVASNLLMADVLGGITIKTYLNGALQQTWKASDLINLSILNPAKQQNIMLSPAPTTSYNQLELSAASAVSAYSVSFFEAFGPSPAPLPVELVSFQGQATPAGVQLSWTTASELNNSHFIVERAAANSTEFTPLGQVAGAGSSNQAYRYQFTDAAALPLGYYRLAQVDADGQTHYSAVVAVQGAPAGPSLAAYPNPAVATLTVASPAATLVAIFDQQGRLLQQATLGAGVAQTLDVSSLPAGLYLLRDATTGQRLGFEKAR